MRCLAKSTTWVGDAVGVVTVVLLGLSASAHAASLDGAAEEASISAVTEAIVSAVRGRMGADTEVSVEDLRVRGDFSGLAGLVATVDPTARLGQRMRFALKAPRGRTRAARVGEADGIVRAKLQVHEVVRGMSRGDVIGEEAVRTVRTWADGLPVKAVPARVVGSRTLRPLTPGDVVLAQDVVAPSTVRSGETVQLKLLVGSLEVILDAVATQDGDVGDEIRIVNPSSGRTLRARVIGPHAVEVHHGS